MLCPFYTLFDLLFDIKIELEGFCYLQEGESQFIMPEGAGRQRGRLELSFSQIGGSIFAGRYFSF